MELILTMITYVAVYNFVVAPLGRAYIEVRVERVVSRNRLKKGARP